MQCAGSPSSRCLFAVPCARPPHAQQQSFAQFTAALWPDAKAKGITRATFERAMKGVTPDKRVIAATKRQPEYGKPIGDYINALASRGRIVRGKRKAQRMGEDRSAPVEKKFRVERWVLLALWGMETDYGAAKDRWDVFRSLATLAYVGYRDPYFRNELIVAMGIMQHDHFARSRMVSSWAGAMGQTQFMPSNFVDFAIDFSGDGSSDIWSNVPDVLGSTANYLHKGHWQYGLPWGFEVSVPKGFDMMHSRATFAEWLELGVRPADGKTFPPTAPASCSFRPAPRGPPSSPPTITPCSRSTTTRMPTRSPSAISPTACAAARRSRPNGRPTIIRSRATPASRCRRSSPRSATR